jgi:Angiotensin-converting enzyme
MTIKNVFCVFASIATSEWKYATNATDYNRRRMKEQQNLAAKFECVSWRRASLFDTSRILEPSLRRQLGRILQQGKCGLGDEKHLEVRISAFFIFFFLERLQLDCVNIFEIVNGKEI